MISHVIPKNKITAR